MTEKQVISRLQMIVANAGGQRAWSRAKGFSAAYVNDVLKGRRAPAEKICKAIGIERRVVYRIDYERLGKS